MPSSTEIRRLADRTAEPRNGELTAAERGAIEQRFSTGLAAVRRRSRRGRIALNVLGLVIFLAVWEAVPRLIPDLNTLMFPPPSGVVGAFAALVGSGEIFVHMGYSLMRAAGGFAIGASLGVLLGVLTGRLDVLRHLSDPVLQGMRAIPAIAFVPLAVAWFGLGEGAKIFLIAWGSFFPVWINTLVGVREVPGVFIRSAESMGAGPTTIMLRVVLPAALPFIAAGLRLATATALVVLVAAELVGASHGLGYLISFSHLVFRIDMMFVGLLSLGIVGFTADRIFVFVIHRLFPWYQAEARR